MFKKIIKYIRFLNTLKAEQKSTYKEDKYSDNQYIIHKKIEPNLTNLKNVLGKSNDVIFREFKIGVKKQTKAFICFIDGLTHITTINEFVVKALMVDTHIADYDKKLLPQDIFTVVKENIISVAGLKEAKSFDEVLGAVLSGDTVLFINGYDTVLIIDAKGWESRSIGEPATESVVRGPREGFSETLRVNTSLLRRIIRNPNLIFETFRLGKQTHTTICIGYIDGIANKKIVEEVKNRLNRIDTDSILESGYIEQFIEDAPLSPFSTIGNTEKPDVIAAKLLEGRVAILCDGAPNVLTVPHLFIETIQISEDYYSRPYLASLIRLTRLLSIFISLMTPALYVAIQTFHQEMIPTVLLISMAAAREGIPFPAFVEAMLMIIMFELLREAGVRMPRPVGQAVSIVGALVIGEAAVAAGIVSAPMVIVVAITGITSFIVPPLLDFIIISRLFLILLSGAFGLFGVVVGLIFILTHMCSLRSFGTPYLAPIAPIIWKELKDTFIRVPLWLMKSRPKSITWRISKRQDFSLMPNPPTDDNGGEDN